MEMMFKNKEQFEFFSGVDLVHKLYPIEPIKNIKMDWAKNAKNMFSNVAGETATHLCSGIRSICSNGWVVKSWCDFELTTNGDGFSFQALLPHERVKHIHYCEPLTYFPAEQAGNIIPVLNGTMRSMVKVNTPWMFSAPKGWGLLFIPLQYHGETRFSSSIGILDPRVNNEINPVLFWHSNNSKEIVKAGTPLCQIVPIQLDHVEASVRVATKKEMEWKDLENHIKHTTFRTNTKTIVDLYEKFFKGKK
jgi:hypothetical protein